MLQTGVSLTILSHADMSNLGSLRLFRRLQRPTVSHWFLSVAGRHLGRQEVSRLEHPHSDFRNSRRLNCLPD